MISYYADKFVRSYPNPEEANVPKVYVQATNCKALTSLGEAINRYCLAKALSSDFVLFSSLSRPQNVEGIAVLNSPDHLLRQNILDGLCNHHLSGSSPERFVCPWS